LRDDDTGLFNEVYFLTRLEEEIKRSERYLRDVSVVLLQFNYEFAPGSVEEKELVRAVARVLRRKSRASDILARTDSNCFVVLLPETRLEDASVAGERLREQVRDYLSGLGSDFDTVEVVQGIASYPEHGEDGDVIMQEAIQSVMRESEF
jgi:diguanylate cyclase (GGDEF)-like protein